VRRSIKILALSFLAIMILACLGPGLLMLPVTLLFGWIAASIRILAVATAQPGTLVWSGLALGMLLAGTHWLGAWVWRGSRLGAEGGNWPWRWTLMLHGGLMAVLFAAMSVVGVAHQLGWLIASGEPLYARPAKHRDRNAMYLAGQAIEDLGGKLNWNITAMRTQVWSSVPDAKDSSERMRTIFLEATNGRPACALVFPRDPNSFQWAGLLVVGPDKVFDRKPAGELTHWLQRVEPEPRPSGGAR